VALAVGPGSWPLPPAAGLSERALYTAASASTNNKPATKTMNFVADRRRWGVFTLAPCFVPFRADRNADRLQCLASWLSTAPQYVNCLA
jgi:hypothetical protein